MNRTQAAMVGALLVVGAAATAYLWMGAAAESPWGVVWAEQVDDDTAVLVWRSDEPSVTRISRISLDDGSAERTLEDEGRLEVLARTPAVLWVRHDGGIMAVELPELVRHRVEGTLRSDPRLSSHQRVVGTTIDRLVLVNEEDARFAVSTDGTIEGLDDETHVEPLGEMSIRTPVTEEGPHALQGTELTRPAFVTELGRVVTMNDGALVVGREGSGPSETHEVALSEDGTLTWRAPAIEGGGRVIWASAQGALRFIALARRLEAPEGEGPGVWLHRSELVIVDAASGPSRRISLSPGEP